MFQTKVEAAVQPGSRERIATIGALLFATVVLAYALQAFFRSALKAILYPFGIDYGEGIVWQQALQMEAGTSYGDITGFPAIVFHYPPVYHAFTIALAEAGGLDFLMAGRIVSFAATLVAGLFAGLIVYHVVRSEARRGVAAGCAVIGGLITLSFAPVTHWAPLMRVDMVATAFALAGLWLAMLAPSKPRLIHLAALCFVAAVFTKQTAIAAPAAAFLVLLVLKPRIAWAGIATSLAAGLATLAVLAWVTDGGFLRHIFFYNINRFDLSRVSMIARFGSMHVLYLAAGCIGAALWIRSRSPGYRGAGGLAGLRQRLAGSEADIGMAVLLAYFLVTTLMLITVAKVGSNYNYFIDWMFAAGILAGIGCWQAARLALEPRASAPKPGLVALLLPALIGFQAVLLPPAPDYAERLDPTRVAELERLTAMVRAAERPVISDDMVVLLRGGQPVMWESAIFAELASKGVWNPRPFADRIRRGEFAFFVTDGGRGAPYFEDRYGQFMAAAIDQAYPVKRVLAGFTLHLPAGQDEPGRRTARPGGY
jgi:hypothetical protein